MEPRLAEHDPAWMEVFQAEADRIRNALGDLVVAIEHVGSTAVAGLAAKPTVDIAVAVRSLSLPNEVVERIKAAGYEDALADNRPGERRFRKGSEVPREVIVHVVEWRGDMWRSLLTFRDVLRRNPDLVREYELLKRHLLAERGEWYHGVDKRAFIEAALVRADASIEFVSESPEETEAIAGRLAAQLRPGDVVTISGELGAGKTTFVRGGARALGVTARVTSPTYTIGHRYDGVSHLDLYRFDNLTAADWGALEPYFEDAICFVEWPEAAAGWLPEPRVAVTLMHEGTESRRIVIEGAEV